MKKIHLFILIATLAFFLGPLASNKPLLAADGTFDCRWNKNHETCIVTSNKCGKNFEPNASKCSVLDETGCESAQPYECVLKDKQPLDVYCDGGTGIQTAIGCIHVLSDKESFVTDILKWAVGIGSGIAFLLMLYAGFMIMTASGNPERLKAGQELLTSAIAGLILLIFSIFILKLIGIDILGLDQFGFGGS